MIITFSYLSIIQILNYASDFSYIAGHVNESVSNLFLYHAMQWGSSQFCWALPSCILYSQANSVAGLTNINMQPCVQCHLKTRRHFFKAGGFKGTQEIEVVPGSHIVDRCYLPWWHIADRCYLPWSHIVDRFYLHWWSLCLMAVSGACTWKQWHIHGYSAVLNC